MHDVIEVKRGEEAERLGFLGLYLDKQLTKKGKTCIIQTRKKVSHDKPCIQNSRIYKM